MSILGLNSKDRKSIRDKANISNPKVNRGCAPLTANRISADCVQNSLGPSIPYIPLEVYHTGGFNAMENFVKMTTFSFQCSYTQLSELDKSNHISMGYIIDNFGCFEFMWKMLSLCYGWHEYHTDLGDPKNKFAIHIIIIIKSEVSNFPIVVIFFHSCVSEVVVPYTVTDYIFWLYIYI